MVLKGREKWRGKRRQRRGGEKINAEWLKQWEEGEEEGEEEEEEVRKAKVKQRCRTGIEPERLHLPNTSTSCDSELRVVGSVSGGISRTSSASDLAPKPVTLTREHTPQAALFHTVTLQSPCLRCGRVLEVMSYYTNSK